MSKILQVYEQALADKASERPAIVIDEANKLTSWSSKYPAELDALLSFFVAVTKEQNLTHVLLLTSDYAFIAWLEMREPPARPDSATLFIDNAMLCPPGPAQCVLGHAGVGQTFYKVKVIGDFPADQARQFFDTLVKGKVSEKDWELVYEVSWKHLDLTVTVTATHADILMQGGLQVCGGNAGLLRSTADTSFEGDLREGKCWRCHTHAAAYRVMHAASIRPHVLCSRDGHRQNGVRRRAAGPGAQRRCGLHGSAVCRSSTSHN